MWRDLRVTRRSGDAANALQVADAGINDAIKSVRNAVPVVGACPQYPALAGFTRTASLASGAYTYCAAETQDSTGRSVWYIDATGTDATGVERRVRSEAVAEPLFPNAINVIASGSFSSGFSVDSYKDEVNRCTKKGVIGTNSPSTFSFGNNGLNSSDNCQNNPNGTFPHPPDGCVAYSINGTATIPASKTGSGQCPPATTTTASPEFSMATPDPPTTYDYPASGQSNANFSCTQPNLVAGKTYFYNAVTLGVGCGFPAAGPHPSMASPTIIYTTALTIAGGNGNSVTNAINPPPNSSAVCGATHGAAGANAWYCPGWPGALQIYVIGNGTVTFSGNHSVFWGVIKAPSGSATWSGGGGAQYEIFGSMVAQSVSGGVQAKWHYDENLGGLTTGRFFGRNWREEPLQ
ncbi:MAG TPA: hypothetical protein VM938_08440 [Acidimicrobiales bacterium]|nr:hypothetical protein [Acidimicrobiales bacterium]